MEFSMAIKKLLSYQALLILMQQRKQKFCRIDTGLADSIGAGH
jgi:hypothetical protein